MSPLDGKAIVFNGFDQYRSHFSQLWKLLSPEGVAENRALRDLAQYHSPRLPEKAITSIGEPREYRYRSEFQDNLRALGSILLDDIDENHAIRSEFYRECYVPLDANNRHLMLSKNIIASRYRRAADSSIVPAKAAAKVVHGKVHVDSQMQVGPEGAKPIVVIGDVGVGKTSFFENLYEELSDAQKRATYYIHLDLGENATLSQSIKSYVVSVIPKLLKEKHGVNINSSDFIENAYRDELVDFEESVEGRFKTIDQSRYEISRIEFLKKKTEKADEHLHASLLYLNKHRSRQIILVLDNADQRDFATQQEAFLIAQELAATRNLLVFVALRPSTFYQSKLTGALSGYQNRVLTISPPSS